MCKVGYLGFKGGGGGDHSKLGGPLVKVEKGEPKGGERSAGESIHSHLPPNAAMLWCLVLKSLHRLQTWKVYVQLAWVIYACQTNLIT